MKSTLLILLSLFTVSTFSATSYISDEEIYLEEEQFVDYIPLKYF